MVSITKANCRRLDLKSRHFAFTWNNFTDESVAKLKELEEKEGSKLKCGKASEETGIEEETPHLQGFLEFINGSG